MTAKSQSSTAYAHLGELLHTLSIPVKCAGDANKAIDSILETLSVVDLPHTLGTATQLRNFQQTSLRRYQDGNSVQNADQTELNSIARTPTQSLHHEASSKQTLVLDPSSVSDSLRTLQDRLQYLTETQTHLKSEAIRCLECGALRSAIVMSWNFSYDYVRHWVFSNHLAAFNNTLTTKYLTNKRQPVYDAITQYHDFWEARPYVGERVFLDTCESSGVITGKAYSSLVEFLRRRNDYAHANFKLPNIDLTKGYIAELIGTITAEHFSEAGQRLDE